MKNLRELTEYDHTCADDFRAHSVRFVLLHFRSLQQINMFTKQHQTFKAALCRKNFSTKR